MNNTHQASRDDRLPLIRAIGRYVRNDKELRNLSSLILVAMRTSVSTVNYDPTTPKEIRPQRHETTGYPAHTRHEANVYTNTKLWRYSFFISAVRAISSAVIECFAPFCLRDTAAFIATAPVDYAHATQIAFLLS